MSTITKMTVDGSTIVLDATQNIDATKHQVVEAARCGGDLVTVDRADTVPISVLITPGVPVSFETFEAPASGPYCEGDNLQVYGEVWE